MPVIRWAIRSGASEAGCPCYSAERVGQFACQQRRANTAAVGYWGVLVGVLAARRRGWWTQGLVLDAVLVVLAGLLCAIAGLRLIGRAYANERRDKAAGRRRSQGQRDHQGQASGESPHGHFLQMGPEATVYPVLRAPLAGQHRDSGAPLLGSRNGGGSLRFVRCLAYVQGAGINGPRNAIADGPSTDLVIL
jgi:hypothetical protein